MFQWYNTAELRKEESFCRKYQAEWEVMTARLQSVRGAEESICSAFGLFFSILEAEAVYPPEQSRGLTSLDI